MNPNDVASAKWHKSSHSYDNGNCVEVADNLPGVVGVRDSKAPGSGTIAVPLKAFAALLHSVR